MNTSLLPTYGKSFLVRWLRLVADRIRGISDHLEQTCMLTECQRKVLARNNQFKDKHKSQRAYVIANGPSLASQNLSALKNEITFVCSGFWKHDVNRLWQPTYYSLLDSNFFIKPPLYAIFTKV